VVDVDVSRAMAQGLLAECAPLRWQHVRSVAARATEILSLVDGVDDALLSAAWLHDIGYTAELVATGFHALDGARYLRRNCFDNRVAGLVAHHSFARVEAHLRGLGEALEEEFPREDSLTADALCYCDMTIGPRGNRTDVVDRLDEIRARYGPHDVVTRFVDLAEPDIVATVRRFEGLLEGFS
jgi:HD superfamily phosphodiesterase